MLPLTPQRVAQKVNLSFKNKFPYISVIAEARGFKFGKQLGFTNYQVPSPNPTRTKNGCGSGLRELPKILGPPLIFLQRLKLAASNLVHSLGLPRPIIKSHPEDQWAWFWVREASIYLGFPFNISATVAMSS